MTGAQGVFFQSALCLPWATALSCLLCSEPSRVVWDVCCFTCCCITRPAHRSVSETPVRFSHGLLEAEGARLLNYEFYLQVILCFINLFLILAVLAIVRAPAKQVRKWLAIRVFVLDMPGDGENVL